MPASGSPLGAYRGTRATVLGASGFIGRWVAQALADAGANVALVARRAPGIDAGLRAHPGVSVHEIDLTGEAVVRAMLDTLRPDIVFNLVGYGVDRGERDEEMAETINTRLIRWIASGTANASAGDWPGQAIVHTGSALEYGAIAGDLREDSPPIPTTLYGRTKLAGTLALREACETRRLRGMTARLFTVYGPGEHDGRLLPTLLAARLHDDPVPLSAGTQRRDFTYVEDVAEGLLRLGACGAAAPGEVVNLATGELTEVRAFALIAARTLGVRAERLRFGALPARAEEMAHDPVSVERLRALVDWVPATEIADGVRRTAARLEGASS
jgi:UDP-glucose 4-epimerase